MELKKMKELTKKCLSESNDPYDINEVMGRMFAANIPFNKLQSLYKTVAIEGGFIEDPQVVREAIDSKIESLDEDDLMFDSFVDMEDWAEEIAEEITGASVALVIRRYRAFAKDNDIELPKRSSGTGRGRIPGVGKIASLILDHCFNEPEVTRQSLYDAFLPHVKAPKNAYDTVNLYFPVIYGLKHGLDAEDCTKKIAGLPLLERPEVNSEDKDETDSE